MTDPTPDRYRHRTEEVEAVQWTGHNADALRAFAGADFDEIELDDRTEDPDETAAVRSHTHGGWLGLTPGDWVVKHADHFSTASDEEFRARWMPAVPAAGLVAVPPTTQTADRAAVPVKQRADCTELEWAEQERARFERLYTREFSRAEKAEADANHNADLVATAARRAEAMERAMESTAADALKHRGCHRDLMGQCLRAERAEAAIERVQEFAASLDEIGRNLAGPEAVHPVAAHIRHLLDTPAAEAPEPATQAEARRAELDPVQLLAAHPDEPLPQTERLVGGQRLRSGDATVDPAVCPRCKGDNSEAFELCATCAAAPAAAQTEEA